MPKRVKAVLILMTVVALGIFVSLAFIGGSSAGCTTPDAIVRVAPDCDESVFQQAPILVELATGYRAELALNGTPIPLDEVTTNVGGDNPGVGAAPTVFSFLPGPGKVIEELRPNENCAVVSYWLIADSQQNARNFRWCFRAA